MSTERNIIQRLAAVMGEVGAVKKDQQNHQMRYNYRGIDQVYNALHPLLAKHEVAVSCKVRQFDARLIQSKSGTEGVFVTVLCEYIFTAPDGSTQSTEILASSSDYSDKAAMQAMSQAQKYALLQAFLIPTEDIKDADAVTPEAVPFDALAADRAEAVKHLEKAGSVDEVTMIADSFPQLKADKGFRAAASKAMKRIKATKVDPMMPADTGDTY